MGAMTSRDPDQHGIDLDLRVRQVRWEADGVVSLILEDPAGNPLPQWAPGSHLDLHLPGGLTRNYSLSGDPADRQSWRVAVLREPAGRGGSAYVHDELRAGQVLAAHGPRNNFSLRPAESYLFIAGGIGITPILPMVRRAQADGTPWRLLYGGRQRASMAFLPELEAYGDAVTVWPQDERGLLPLADVLADPVPGGLVYCCGPGALMAAVEEAMDRWPPESLVIERFAPVAAPPDEHGAAFEVEARRSGVTALVGDGVSVLATLEAAGVEIPNSCREGICGTCETRILEGTADHRDSLLSDEERASMQTMMVCVSRSGGPRLVLDV
ncbi:MAG: PDR/VanB family oxidoreductase [Candidatus Nanopelagicales bacterium]